MSHLGTDERTDRLNIVNIVNPRTDSQKALLVIFNLCKSLELIQGWCRKNLFHLLIKFSDTFQIGKSDFLHAVGCNRSRDYANTGNAKCFSVAFMAPSGGWMSFGG